MICFIWKKKPKLTTLQRNELKIERRKKRQASLLFLFFGTAFSLKVPSLNFIISIPLKQSRFQNTYVLRKVNSIQAWPHAFSNAPTQLQQLGVQFGKFYFISTPTTSRNLKQEYNCSIKTQQQQNFFELRCAKTTPSTAESGPVPGARRPQRSAPGAPHI